MLYLNAFKEKKRKEKMMVLFRRKHFIIPVVAKKHIANEERESEFNLTAKGFELYLNLISEF